MEDLGCGAWLQRGRVEKFMEDYTGMTKEGGVAYITMVKHKTFGKHSAASRPVPPGNAEVYRKLLCIHPATAKMFFDPACIRGDPEVVDMNQLLKKFSAVYLPGYTPIGATLMRAVYHSVERDEDAADKVFQDLCKVDKHKYFTGKKWYKAKRHAIEARKALIHHTSVFGEPVGWPTPEQLAAGEAVSKERLGTFWKRGAQPNAVGELNMPAPDDCSGGIDGGVGKLGNEGPTSSDSSDTSSSTDTSCESDDGGQSGSVVGCTAAAKDVGQGGCSSRQGVQVVPANKGMQKRRQKPAKAKSRPTGFAHSFRRYRLSPDNKACVVKYHNMYLSRYSKTPHYVAPKKWFSLARTKGIDMKALDSLVTAEALRSHVRTEQPHAW